LGEGFAAREVPPVIAQLQPLNEKEAIALLTDVGCQAPGALLSILHTLRSTPFVWFYPLGSKFLMSVQSERLPSLNGDTEMVAPGCRHSLTTWAFNGLG
jgi:hypothetical protein